MRNVLYIAPFITPAVGGCAVYIELLKSMFVMHLTNYNLKILTEKNPNQKNIVNGVYRWFPFRAGRNKKDVFSYIQYLMQNFIYLFIPVILYRDNIRIVFVHSSLIKNPNILTAVLRLFCRIMKIKIVLDVRDPCFSAANANQFKQYDHIVTCSSNVVEKLIDLGINSVHVINIPIIVESDVFKKNNDRINECLSRFDLLPGQYLFNASGILDLKGIKEGIKLAQEINKRYGVSFKYVVCGKNRNWRDEFYMAEKSGVLKYIGEIAHVEAVILGAMAYLDVNLSVVDSMPRHSLEVLASRGRVLLPQGVPEFEKYCPDSVALLPDWEKLSEQAIAIADGKIINNYPIEIHDVNILAFEYIKLMSIIDPL